MHNPNDTSKYDYEIGHEIIQKIAKKNNIELLDTKAFLKNNPNQPLYYPASWHWNKTGHGEIAKFLYSNINL
jgi:hypothetical protein